MRHDHTQFAATEAYRGKAGERVAQFLPMVRKLAWHLAGSGGPTVDVDDLMQAGMVALTECVHRHERPGDDGFAAYAKLRVRGAMVDLLRSTSPDPRGARARRRMIEGTRNRLAATLGRRPDATEMAHELEMSVDDFHRMESDLVETRLAPLDDCYSESDLAFAASEPDAERQVLMQEDRERLVEAIGALNERHQLVIQLYFVEELNLAEIAAVLSVSVPRVHQLKAAALERLRVAMQDA